MSRFINKGSDYRYIISLTSKNEVRNMNQNANLTKESRAL